MEEEIQILKANPNAGISELVDLLAESGFCRPLPGVGAKINEFVMAGEMSLLSERVWFGLWKDEEIQIIKKNPRSTVQELLGLSREAKFPRSVQAIQCKRADLIEALVMKAEVPHSRFSAEEDKTLKSLRVNDTLVEIRKLMVEAGLGDRHEQNYYDRLRSAGLEIKSRWHSWNDAEEAILLNAGGKNFNESQMIFNNCLRKRSRQGEPQPKFMPT